MAVKRVFDRRESHDCADAVADHVPHERKALSGDTLLRVGRVGALAVALGIGGALAGAAVASADTPASDSGSSSGVAHAKKQSPSASSSRPRAMSPTRPAPAAVTDQPAAAVAMNVVAPVATVTRGTGSSGVGRSGATPSRQPVVQAENPVALAVLAWTRRGSAAPSQDAAAPAVAVPQSAMPAVSLSVGTPGGPVVIEAESLPVSPSSAGSTYSDAAASGGRAKLLSKNGSVSTTVTLPDVTSLVIRAKGDQYRGAPMMTVSVDGQVVANTQVASTTWTDYTVPVNAAAGAHTISVAFTNDYRVSASRDRNLRVDKITAIPSPVTDPPPPGTPPYFGGADWLWTPIPSSPTLAANSSTWVGYFSAPNAKRVANLYEYGITLIPSSAVTAGTPRYDVKLTKPWGSDPFGFFTVPIPRGTVVPSGSDGQITVLDPITGKAFGIWQAKYDSKTDTWSGSWGGMTDLNGNGVDQSGSATGTNLARYAGVVTGAEFSRAVAANTGLDHALFFSTDIAGSGFVAPATKSDGSNIAGVALPIPEGARVQLDPSIDVDAIPGITPGEKVIAKTLQTYGAYVGDKGGARMAFAFELQPDATASDPGSVWTDAGLAWDYFDMAHIPWSRLRVIAS